MMGTIGNTKKQIRQHSETKSKRGNDLRPEGLKAITRRGKSIRGETGWLAPMHRVTSWRMIAVGCMWSSQCRGIESMKTTASTSKARTSSPRDCHPPPRYQSANPSKPQTTPTSLDPTPALTYRSPNHSPILPTHKTTNNSPTWSFRWSTNNNRTNRLSRVWKSSVRRWVGRWRCRRFVRCWRWGGVGWGVNEIEWVEGYGW